MDVHNSLNSLLLLNKNDFDEKQITVACNFTESLPQILAVKDQIKQVLLNLLTNAAEACLQPGGMITINTWLVEKWVAVAIKDTGIGIASDKLDRSFSHSPPRRLKSKEQAWACRSVTVSSKNITEKST